MGKLNQVQTLAELQTLVKDNKKVVVDFFATWCGPCKMIAPVIEGLAGEHTDIAFAQVDVDQSEDVAAKYEVTSMPTFLFFFNGEVIDKQIGANQEAIKKKIEQLKARN